MLPELVPNRKPKMNTSRLPFLLLLFVAVGEAAVYECPASAKTFNGKPAPAEVLKKWQFSTKIEELPEGAFYSRCSYTLSEKKVTCDRYKVDRVELDRNVGIKKFYHFSSQSDFQIFTDLTSIENNGRGSITYGICKLVSP